MTKNKARYLARRAVVLMERGLRHGVMRVRKYPPAGGEPPSLGYWLGVDKARERDADRLAVAMAKDGEWVPVHDVRNLLEES